MRNLLMMTLLTSFMAGACPLKKIGITAWTTGFAALSAVTIVYADKARQHLLDNDPGSDLSTHARRLLTATEAFSTMGALLLSASAITLWDGRSFGHVPELLAATAVIPGFMELITSSVAFGLEDNHEYVFPDGLRKKGSSDSNLKVAFGTSLANPFSAMIAAFLVLWVRDPH